MGDRQGGERPFNSRVLANERLLEALRILWEANPDQRFGQLVMNLSRESSGFADTWEWSNATWNERINDAWSGWAAPRSAGGVSGG